MSKKDQKTSQEDFKKPVQLDLFESLNSKEKYLNNLHKIATSKKGGKNLRRVK